MADHTHIEWTDATWNPITGCAIVSPGCTNCYAMKLAGTRLKNIPSRAGLTTDSKSGPVWNGKVRLNEEWLDQPLKWKRPRRIFVCAHGDLFAENVPDEWIDRVFAVMALSPHHTFQVLTKRAERMRQYVADCGRQLGRQHELRSWIEQIAPDTLERTQARIAVSGARSLWKPLPNVWLGVSAERRNEWLQRTMHLRATPAAVRFVSAEPLLGDLGQLNLDGLHWIIVGGESGNGAQPMHPAWARQIRDDCEGAGVPFFFKQWGAWLPGEFGPPPELRWQGKWGPIYDANQFPVDWDYEPDWDDGLSYVDDDDQFFFYRAGKKRAGRLLDGVEHNGMPIPAAGAKS